MLVEVLECREERWIEELDERVQLVPVELHWRSRGKEKRLRASHVGVGQHLRELVEVRLRVLVLPLPRSPRVVRFVDDDHVPAGEGDLSPTVFAPSGEARR